MNNFTNAETAAQLARWTREHQVAAEKEGWNLFDYDTMGLLLIQRSDEAEKFTTDDEAVDFVKAMAAEGDGKAILAMELETYFAPIIDQVREANAALNPRFG